MSEPSLVAGDIHQDGFAVRLRHAVRQHGGASALARSIGRSEGAVRKWMRSESEPNVTDLRAICRACGTSAEWLVNGNGDSGLIPSGVSEPSPLRYGLRYSTLAPMDHDLLEQVMIAIDEAAGAGELKIAINKRSSMVSALYGLCRTTGVIDRDAVARLVKLAV